MPIVSKKTWKRKELNEGMARKVRNLTRKSRFSVPETQGKGAHVADPEIEIRRGQWVQRRAEPCCWSILIRIFILGNSHQRVLEM
jgi:hypothetical protein